MKIETNVWQKVPGTPSVEIFPIIPRANCVSSNCYIFSAPDALVVVDPGASSMQTEQISRVLTDAVATPRRRRNGLSWCFSLIAIKTTRKKRAAWNFRQVQKSNVLRTRSEPRR